MANYDIIGNIAVMKFYDNISMAEKIKKAQEIINQYKSVKSVVEKLDKVSGRLRTIKTRHILGEKNLVAEYFENGCKFLLNIETCYFSPRLANERMEIARILAKDKSIGKKKVIVMFAGVGPFSMAIAKYSKPKKIISMELGKECCKYGRENVIKNKFLDLIEVIQGDVKKKIPEFVRKKEKFDYVIMPRPNLKDSFLKEALLVSKKGTRIIYYGFCAEDKLDNMLEDLSIEAKKAKRKIKVTNVKVAGDIAPYEHRYRVEINVLN